MFRALYDYKTDLSGYLTFSSEDQFTILDSSQKDWYLAQNGYGEVGYIPKNYVTKDKANESEVLESIDRAIQIIHYEAGSKGGKLTHQQRENLQKLIEHRQAVQDSYRNAPTDCADWVVVSPEVKETAKPAEIPTRRQSARRAAPAPPVRTSAELRSSIKQENSTSTKAGQENSTSTKAGQENSTSTKAGQENSTSTKAGQGNSTSTKAGQENSTSPKAGQENSTSTKAGQENSTSTKAGQENSTSTKAGQENSTSTKAEESSKPRSESQNETKTQNKKKDLEPINTQSSKTSSLQPASSIVANATAPSVTSTTDCATSPMPSPTKSVSENCFVDCHAVPVPDDLGNELVEEIRKNTGLSYKNSCVALETVLGHIGLKIPNVSELMDRIHTSIQMNDSETVESEVSSEDYERLCELFKELTECKDDSQQRGWHLHEDEGIISSNLEEMLSILENAKQSVSRKALSRDSYEGVYSLVQYYQMENRLRLRLVLLRVFGAMCSLDSAVITHLLFSVLTTELAEELQQNMEDLQRSSYVSLLLCMLFSTGEAVPANLHDHLNREFLGFVFQSLENPCTEDHEEQVTDLLVNFVLAFNLHFHVPNENLVMNVIEEKKTVKIFTEKILLLFNRDEDPVHMFDYKPHPPNSIMKLLQDMYSSPGTANILYTNDERVLLDIVLRHLIDLPPGDQQRSEHLKLMQLYLQNADYAEHKHRYAELNECLHRILNEEEDTGDDKQICTFIFTQLNIFNNE